jgi:rhamnulokinase
MKSEPTYLAFDIGAGSGRAVAATFQNSRIILQEIHRFHNGPVKILNHYHWALVRLFEEMLNSMRKCGQRELRGIGVCTWGVDHALLNKYDELVNLPYCYRDGRTDGVMEEVFEIIPRSEIYRLTGIQFMPINTLYQLYAYKKHQPELIKSVEHIFMISDLLNFWMTGRKISELTSASTTQFLDVNSDKWCFEIFKRLDLPEDILLPLAGPGSVIDDLNPYVQEETGLGNIPVIMPACHDTASAFASIPTTSENFSFISSGTWSLIGTETSHPIISEEGLNYNITNERAPGQKNMLRKNNMGLWLIQESMRIWNDSGKNYTDDILVKMATETKSVGSFIEPDHSSFFQPGDIPTRVKKFCAHTNQEIPDTDGEICRCIFESLAFKYRWVLEVVEKIKGIKSEILHIVGGGSKNELLCQLAANTTGKIVIAGPDEATITGNVLLQAIADGYISSIEEGKNFIIDSFDLREYYPEYVDKWEEMYVKFLKIKKLTDTLI